MSSLPMSQWRAFYAFAAELEPTSSKAQAASTFSGVQIINPNQGTCKLAAAAAMEGEIEVEPQLPPIRAPHIKKRALKNKALAVSFNEKDLRDYVTGFHKRKKKRRKEAQKQQEEALRRKRIEDRKKRRLERELVLYGEAPPASGDGDGYSEDGEEIDPIASVSGTLEYDNGDMKVTVTTSEISREDKDDHSGKMQTAVPMSRLAAGDDKKHNLAVSKKKSFKKVSKHKSRSKPHNKRDKKKGKKKNKKR